MFPAVHFIEPERVREMMECDHRRHAAFTQLAQRVTVMLQRILVPCIRRRLDAAPFHRHAMSGLPRLCGAVEVLLPAPTPPIAGQTRRPFGMPFLLPFPPLVVGIVSFHLMRGRGRPP